MRQQAAATSINQPVNAFKIAVVVRVWHLAHRGVQGDLSVEDESHELRLAHGADALAVIDHLAPEGRLVVYGFHGMLPKGRGRAPWWRLARDWIRTPRFHPLDLTTDNKSVMAFNLSFLFHRGDLLADAMGEILGHVTCGALRPPATETFPLADAAAAHRRIQGGATVGKLVLVP